MIECFCCKQIGYMKSTFKFFPKREGTGHHPICMMCVPYVTKSIEEYESAQTKLSDF